MKSSGFGWEALSAVEVLGAPCFADGEFCADAELVVANAIDIIVITRNFFWFTGSFLNNESKLGGEFCPQLSTT